jgi:4'-phosphopantetheinyl transferase EntD
MIEETAASTTDVSELFGPGVVIEECDPRTVSPEHDATELSAVERAAIARAVPVRRREFIAGRLCARRALRRLGLCVSSIPVGSGREPVFPSQVVGSITHTRTHCAVAVAMRSEYRSLGLDVEDAVDLPRDLYGQVLRVEERAWLAEQTPVREGVLARILFSAKESFYKCQFGVTGSWVGFEDALVRVDPSSCSFTIRLLRDVELLRANEEWAGRILLAHDRIHTALEMRAGPGD